MASRPVVAVAAAAALAVQGCSLLAPDDDYFSGGPAPADAGAETPCQPAPPCSVSAGPATISVAPAQAPELHSIVADAPAGSVIELAPGTYPLTEPLGFAHTGVTLRSSTGDPEDVTIDGQGYPAVVEITASDVTLAGFTLVNVGAGGMGLLGVAVIPLPEQRLVGTRLCSVTLRDAGREHFVEVRRNAQGGVADCGRVEGSMLVLGPEAALPLCAPGAGVPNGISVGGGWGWVVTTSAVGGFSCVPTDPANPQGTCSSPPFAMVFAQGSRDTVIENNCIVGAGRGIGLGMEELEARTYADRPYGLDQLSHIDGVVRNNVIFGRDCYDTGIEQNYARRPVVVHNTVVAEGVVIYKAIDARFSASSVFVWNNLVDPSGLGTRASAELDEGGNVVVAQADLASVFTDPATWDMHLLPGAASAIDAGEPLDEDTGLDLDGREHESAAPDVGADELGEMAPAPLTPCWRLQ